MPFRLDPEQLLDAIPTPVYYKNAQGEIIDCNDAYARLFRLERGQVIGRTVHELYPPELARLHEEADQRLLRDGGQVQYEVAMEVPGEEPCHLLVHKHLYEHQPAGERIIVGTLFDITEQKRIERRLAYEASHDQLTGLVNRHEMQRIMARTHARAERYGEPFTLVLVDLDHFKIINDNYGHAAGDRILVAFARIARQLTRETDTVARWGGEEFLFLLDNTDALHAAGFAERLRTRIEATPIDIGNQEVHITISAGVASYPEDATAISELLTLADNTLFEAKRGGRNRVVFPSKDSSGIFTIGTQLNRALEQERLIPAYQPIVDLATREVMAEEALARIRTGQDDELLDAESFIQAANDLQLAHRIDHHIISSTLRRCIAQEDLGVRRKYFVNMSADLLRHPELTREIIEQASQAWNDCKVLPTEARPIVIEITEREFLGHVDAATEILQPLIDFGLEIAIDDFGSGYSSFQYLADLPVSYLKIEGSLIQRCVREPKVRRIIHAIRDIARDLDLITIAEHIEDEATADLLAEMGIDWGQGYLFGRATFGSIPDPE
ncbi:MAG: EAL domain-containing protein [Gammaproteobacteria bacterium]|nr:MAG: EAL domain-containing protein [Gammaproteobacteria bacterium]